MPASDLGPRAAARPSLLARLAPPYTFAPALHPRDALVAVAGTLVRLFGSCILFALWGALSLRAWSSLTGTFWRIVALPPLVLLFAAVFGGFLMAVSALERRLVRRS